MPDTAPLTAESDPRECFDVLIVGAGLSGIGAAHALQTRCPTKSYAILESRGAIGGTWDLFRYPGIRSDSDMYTLGYSFRPWRGERAMTDGASIRHYIQEASSAYGIERHIRFGHRVTRAVWSSEEALWTVEAETGSGTTACFACRFLYLCTGYYDYEGGYQPAWPGLERYAGALIHPQHWPEALDLAGRRVVVIGSGATAVTLVPELAKTAAHVTMLQRSPSYVVSLPSRDAVADWLHRRLPERWAHGRARWKNVLITMAFYNLARIAPRLARRGIERGVAKELGQAYDVKAHFSPLYDPWDQRLCLVPDGDLFDAIRSGRASVVTDEIETFTESGLQLRSGRALEADAIVTATGLKLRLVGGLKAEIDRVSVDPAQAFLYKGAMLSDVPNLACAIGYTNASWTLKCELTSAYVCRLLNHMDAKGYVVCTPRLKEPVPGEPAITLTSGYIQRALAMLPKQGPRKPWRLHQNYVLDLIALKFGRIEDGAMEFKAAPEARPAVRNPDALTAERAIQQRRR